MPEMIMETERLILRSFRATDRDVFASINADPEVMRYFPAPLSRELSDALMDKALAKEKSDGFCFAPIEEKASGDFLGFVGLSRPSYAKPLPCDPCVEVGWRLARSAWGKGYATEAAGAWLRFGFITLDLEEIVSFTTVTNAPSRRVMERLGMAYDPADDFLHPAVEQGHPLEPHVLYRLGRKDWVAQTGG
ncbi:GNAT family N-acetyltransferase [Roseibium polysiphoniae]|uniref:GNAT family N-acetyltransferase n=1 Tax=Roseibium polysiphoniae TaxID=2571221 RepID=UPI003299AA9C